MSDKFYELYCEEVEKNEKLRAKLKESKNEKLENKFKHLKVENQSLKNRIDYLESTIAESIERAVAQVAAGYEEKISELNHKVASLQSILNNNGTNSGISTASTPIHKEKRIPNTREKSEKSIGGQFGHSKHQLEAFSEEEITEHVHHEQVSCPKCQGDMHRTGEEKTRDEYEIEVIVKKIRHHFHTVECPTCKSNVSEAIPEHLHGQNQYGAGIGAMILALINIGFVSMMRTRELMSGFSLGEIVLSVGYIAKLQKRVAKLLIPFMLSVRQAIIASTLVCWDDTVIMINKKRSCLRVYTNEQVVLYTAHETKGKEGIDEDGILLALDEQTIVMHDHNIINYNDDYVFQNAECCVHLLRDLKKVDDNLSHPWAPDLHELLTTINARRNSGDYFDVDEVKSQVREVIAQGWSQHEQARPNAYYLDKEAALLRRLEKYFDNYLMWLWHEDVPFSNNESERNLRSSKTKMKISGQFQNIKRAEDFAVIKTYIETGKRHGINRVLLLKRAIVGDFMTLDEMQQFQIDQA